MATNASPDGARRRVMRRRNAGMSFSGGGLSHSSSGGGVADADTDDGEAEVEDLNAAVAENAVAVPRITDDHVSTMARNAQNGEEYTPAARLLQVGSRSSEYAREYRLNLLQRLLMRGLPLDEIAQAMGCSVSTVLRDRKELTERARQAAKELDIDVMIGNSTALYGEVSAMAMRQASNAQTPVPMRLASMRTALAAENDKHRFYQAAGVYDVLRFRRGAGEGQVSDISRLMTATEELLNEAAREVRQKKNPNPLGEFSGGDEEVMDL